MTRSGQLPVLPHPPRYWRSLEERAGFAGASPEFPEGADRAPDGTTRREFLKIVGASAALAGLQACERPVGTVLPYVHRPPEVTPGIPLAYATTMVLDGYGIGLLAQSREGRPVMVEGNPDHPSSLGALGPFEQASILQLYDPHRGRLILESAQPRSWGRFVRAVQGPDGPRPPDGASAPLVPSGGRGLHFLLQPTSSPFRIHWIDAIRSRLPEARFHFFSPTGGTAELEGARLAFGRPLVPRHDFRRARVVVALESNFLAEGPARIRNARHFALARRPDGPGSAMNRLYAAAPMLDPTAATADHHLPARSSEIEWIAVALHAAILDPSAALPGLGPDAADWVRHAARDLREYARSGVVIAGPHQPPEVHALVHVINERLGNLGRTVTLGEPVIHEAGSTSHGLRPLVGEMGAGRVDTLVVLDSNPAYTAPADLDFAAALRGVRTSICGGLYENETAALCDWYLPTTHYLEAWGDTRAYDGTLSTIQPLIRPLYDGHSVDDILRAFAGAESVPADAAVREVWRRQVLAGPAVDFEELWRESLRSGVVAGSDTPTVRATPAIDADSLTRQLRTRRERAHRQTRISAERLKAAPSPRERGDGVPGPPDPPASTAPIPAGVVEIAIRPDPRVYDGRFANNAWLLELPDPITKLTWENAALLSPVTAARLGVAERRRGTPGGRWPRPRDPGPARPGPRP